MRRFAFGALVLAFGLAGSAWAGGLQALERFLRDTQQGRATFTQTVIPPRSAADARPPRPKVSRGTFEFQRPDRFRFVYTQPFEQTIVADGQTLWLYDVDLQQVTVRGQRDALANTPAALVAASADLAALRQVFDLADAPAQDGLTWVQANPKAADGPLASVRLGFRGDRLAALDIVDRFGQRSELRFGDLDTQVRFGPRHFQFQPPAGVDVLRP